MASSGMVSQSHIFPERVANADLVIIQRDFPRHFEAYQAVMAQAREHGKKVVYELDDLLTELPEAHPDYDHYRKSRANILTAVCEADAVVCSTPGIRDYLYAFNPNIFVFPNYLDDTLWPLRSGREQIDETPNRPLMLGYLGSHSHMQDLEIVAPVLEKLLSRHANGLGLKLWGIGIPQGRQIAQTLNLSFLAWYITPSLQHISASRNVISSSRL